MLIRRQRKEKKRQSKMKHMGIYLYNTPLKYESVCVFKLGYVSLYPGSTAKSPS